MNKATKPQGSQVEKTALPVQFRVLHRVREATREMVIAFQKAYVEQVIRRPLLTQGMLMSAKSGPATVDSYDRYVVLIDNEQSEREAVISFFHELLHIQLLIAGIAANQHDEDAIEESAIVLADRFPDILTAA